MNKQTHPETPKLQSPATAKQPVDGPTVTINQRSARANTLRNTLIFSGGTLVSRLFGFVRLALTIFVLTKTVNDVFQMANTLPNQVYELFLSSALSAVLIPAIIRSAKNKNSEKFLNALFFVGFVALAIGAILATVAAPLLVRLFGYKIPAGWMWVATAIAFWCLPQIFFYGAHSLLGQYLNANNRFVAYAWSPVVNNVIGIVGLLVFYWVYPKGSAAALAFQNPENFGPEAVALLAAPATLGIIVQAACVYFPARAAGLRLHWPKQIRGLGLGETLKQGGWAVAVVVFSQFSVIAQSNVQGAAFAWSQHTHIAAPSYTERMAANLFYALPLSVVIISVVNVLFPQIVEAVVEKQSERVRSLTYAYHRYVGSLCLFCAVVLMTCAIPLAQSLTIFSSYDPWLVAMVLICAAPNIFPTAISMLNTRILYAQTRMKEVFLSNILPMLVTVGLCFAAVQLPSGVYWVPAASAASFFSTWTLVLCYRHYISPEFKVSPLRVMKGYARPLVGVIAQAVVGLGFLYLVGFYTDSFLLLAVKGLSAVAMEAATFLAFGLDDDGRDWLFSKFARRR